MNLWKNLDKITAQLKNSPAKVLMLDFDGTLTPIVKSPKEAKLSYEMKNLLIKLSKKEGLYLAIISGRKLADLKKKVNLQNIIYGGSHGLEGEIFGQKQSFPIPNKTLVILRNIREQLNKLAGQITGVFIEDKGSVLSFHYRLVDKQQIPELRLLFKEILQPYVEDGSISSVAGKMVFTIHPKVNWNKGSFAKMVVEKIPTNSKTVPTAVFIGDDTTDEDVFQVLKKSITIKVGASNQSSAKYRLKDTKDVFSFLEWMNTTLV
ncbi:trehalose-phosphatase [Candidatus Daviesbacteria bacterium]|nr:trehalose-phosphatase [Candidatus Daviesbacteria bacterium]